MYRGITRSTTGKRPAELLLRRRPRGEPAQIIAAHMDLEASDKNTEQIRKSKQPRKAEHSAVVDVGDLARREKVEKFTTTFNKATRTVVGKKWKCGITWWSKVQLKYNQCEAVRGRIKK